MKKYTDGDSYKNLGKISEYLGYSRVYLYQYMKRGGWPARLKGKGPWSLDEVQEAVAMEISKKITLKSRYGQFISLLPMALENNGDYKAAEYLRKSLLFKLLQQTKEKNQ